MSLFKRKPILFETMYEKDGDLAGFIFLSNVIDNMSFLETAIAEFDYSISKLEDIYDYLWFVDFIEMSKEISSFKIDNNIKVRIIELSKLIKPNNKAFIQFTNNNIDLVLGKQNIIEPMRWYRYLPRMMQICYQKLTTGLDRQVFEYFENRYYLNVLSSFYICNKYYQKNKDFFKRLFLPLKNTTPFDDQVYTKFLLNKKKNENDEFLKTQAMFICERAYCEITKIGLDSNSNRIIQIIDLFEEYYDLARVYMLKCANDFKLYKPKLLTAMDDYLTKNGQHINLGPIDLQRALDCFKNSNSSLKFFSLTHTQKGNGYFNNLDRIFENKSEANLIDAFSHINVVTSDRYPYSNQEEMELTLSLNSKILHLLISQSELATDLASYIQIICSYVQQRYFENEINILDEIGGSYEVINNLYIMQQDNQSKTLLYKSLCNGCCVNLCGTIEKILRNIFIKEKQSRIYIEEDKLTIGNLLNTKEGICSLSKGIKYYLKYYLSNDEEASEIREKRPGMNIRNKQMHNANDKYDKTDYQLCLKLFYLTLSLVGDLVNESWED